ncbi:MAG: hypothetical protein OXH84_08840 [Gammaproteobacteria bacterium]|nr:hypothetical protein [Gammaproteobacteria bacterium]
MKFLCVSVSLLYGTYLHSHGIPVFSGPIHILPSCEVKEEEYYYLQRSRISDEWVDVIVTESVYYEDCVLLFHLHETQEARYMRFLREVDKWLISKVEEFLDCSEDEIENRRFCGSTEENENSDKYPVDWLQFFLRKDLMNIGYLVVGDCSGERTTGCTHIQLVVYEDNETKEEITEVRLGVTTIDLEKIYEIAESSNDKRLAIGDLASSIFHERLHHKWDAVDIEESKKQETLVDDTDEHDTLRTMNVKTLGAITGTKEKEWALGIYEQCPTDLYERKRVYLIGITR